MSHLTLTLLGAFQAHLDGAPLTNFHSVKVQGLLAYLAMEAARPHTREALMALLWPDDAPQSAQQSLRQALYALRRVLGDTENPAGEPFLLVTRQTIQLNPRSQVTLDVTTFLQQVQQSNLAQAVALYPADLLVGMTTDSTPFEEWLRATREYLHNLALNALNPLTQQQLDKGDYAEAVTYARRQLTLEPWREEAHRQALTALALSGERSAALAQYESCRRVLADELGVDPAAETIALYEQIRSGQLRGQAARANPLPASPSVGEEAARPAPRHNLPSQPTPFIGRKTDLEQITTRLDDPTCRLLTIVGPGGMGKTRLAIQTAQAALAWGFADGVFFVGLAGVGSPDLLVSTIAAALDFTFYSSGDAKTQLVDYLRTKTLLLLLDNCEHLLDGIELVADLLTAAPTLKVLATSREPLNLREEWLHTLSGMSFPRTGENGAKLEQYTAVQLFVQCARRMKPAFDLDTESHGVVQICQLVDGMPLGIELAATWLKFYGCPQIVQEMQRSLDFLASTLRNVPARHRSMRAVFEHSWSLLSPAERQVLQRLAVFRGGFRLDAAQQVAEASFPLLGALVEKSLVQPAPSGRYQMHEILRQFAEEKLQAVPYAADEMQDHHCFYFATFLQKQECRLKGAQYLSALADVEVELENIRHAWQWAVAHRRVVVIDLALNSLYAFYLLKSWYQEGEMLFQQAAEALRAKEPVGHQGVVFGMALAAQAQLQTWMRTEMDEQVSPEDTIAMLEESLTILRLLNAHEVTGGALSRQGAVLCWSGNFERGLHLIKNAVTIFTAQGDYWGMSRSLLELAYYTAWLGEYPAAIEYYQQSIAICKTHGDLRTLGDALTLLGYGHMRYGEYKEAQKIGEAALATVTAVGDKRGIGWSLNLLGEVALYLGDYTTAQQRSQESLTLFRELGLVRLQDSPLIVLGHIAYKLANYTQAKTYFSTVLEPPLRAGTLSHFWSVPAALYGLATVFMSTGKERQAVEICHHALCHPAIWQELKDRVQRLMAELIVRLSPEVVTAQTLKATNELAGAIAQWLEN